MWGHEDRHVLEVHWTARLAKSTTTTTKTKTNKKKNQKQTNKKKPKPKVKTTQAALHSNAYI
jgi:hypothetical protein